MSGGANAPWEVGAIHCRRRCGIPNPSRPSFVTGDSGSCKSRRRSLFSNLERVAGSEAEIRARFAKLENCATG